MRLFALVLLALLAKRSAPAQAPAASPAPSSSIKVTTHLVQINVLVHDHHNVPIEDLKKEDFELNDDGKAQAIALFTVDSLAAGNRAGGLQARQPVMPRNLVTNRPERQANVPTSVTVLLMDLYNTKLTDQVYARRQVIKFLRQIRQEDRIAVYLLKGAGFSVIHDFTNNSESLLAALAKVLPGFSHELDGSEVGISNTGNDEMDTFIDTSNTVMSNFYIRNRVLNTCLSFKTLADHLAGVPGRKNVIWVSGGFPIAFGYGDSGDIIDRSQIGNGASGQDRELFGDYIEDVSRAMSTANVAVYPVDARGLMGLPFADASKNIKVDRRTGQIPESMMHVDRRNMDTMNYIAELTGGKAFYNTNDIEGAIRKAIDDSDVTYTLGYYVSEDNWDNKFHKIRVRVKRSGVTVRTKRGYLASDKPAPTPGKLDQILREAVWSPLDATSLSVTARIDPSPALPNASRLLYAVEPAEIQFKPENNKYNGSLNVVFVQQTKQGKLIADATKTINITATTAQLEQLRAKGLLNGEDLKLNPDTEAVRVVILDRGTGSTGSVTIKVTAEDRSGPTPAPRPTANRPGANAPRPGGAH